MSSTLNQPCVAGRDRHDLRVDPSWVIVLFRDTAMVRVACAAPGCEFDAVVESPRRKDVDANDVTTWRRYVDRVI